MSENGSSISSTDQKIIRQIEYYFGDFNLPKDKFLLEEVKKEDGWVTMDTMTKFKRLASVTTDHKVIAEALRKSTNDLMQVNEDGSKIRRNPDNPAPETMKEVYEKYEDRTAFVKGFGKDETLNNIEDFLDKAGTIVNIVMRRRPMAKDFKGSIFVSFKEKDDCDKFLTADEFKAYNGTDLIRKLRVDYVKEKAEARQQSKAKNAESRADAEGKRQEMQKARLRSHMTLGALLELSGIPKGVAESQVITRIKAMMKEAGTADVAYVETDKLKDGKVIIRFKEENTAAEALAKLQASENGMKFPQESEDKKKSEAKAAGSESAAVEGKDDSKKMEAADESADKTENKEGTGGADDVDAVSDSKADDKKSEVSDMVGRVLVGEDEETAWQNILRERQQRTNKRKGGYRRGRDGEPNQKRGRFSH